ncbi:MAG: hypothetical protein HRT70_04880 [Flavobacteriaceae bacterium]|nr:hypothetical protein [Flavobacteriaceae bacterium]
MSFFQNIDDFKKQVGGAVNYSLDFDSISPIIITTGHNHIIPWIGLGLWTDIYGEYLTFLENGTELSAQNQALLPYLQKTIAHLTMFEYMHIGGIQVSDSGAHRVENENMKSAYKYQETQYQNWMRDNGYEHLEQMMDFLKVNANDYPLWTNSNEYNQSFNLVINSAAEIRLYIGKRISRYTYEILRTIIEDVEIFSLIPHMGEDQYQDIKDKIAGGNVLSDNDAQLLALMQKVVAEFAVFEGIKRQMVRLEGHSVVQSETLEPQGFEKLSVPGNAMTNLKLNSHESFANRYVTNLINFLEKNRVDFPLYDAYKTALEEEAAEAEAAENDCPADWERPFDMERCNCGEYQYCDCNRRKNKAVINL